MRTTRLLSMALLGILLSAVVGSAELSFGAIGELNTQFNRSLVGDVSLPGGIAPEYVTRADNATVTRGETWTNLGPTCACTALTYKPSPWVVPPSLLVRGTPLLVGPLVAAENRDFCAAGVTVIASCPITSRCCAVRPLTIISLW